MDAKMNDIQIRLHFDDDQIKGMREWAMATNQAVVEFREAQGALPANFSGIQEAIIAAGAMPGIAALINAHGLAEQERELAASVRMSVPEYRDWLTEQELEALFNNSNDANLLFGDLAGFPEPPDKEAGFVCVGNDIWLPKELYERRSRQQKAQARQARHMPIRRVKKGEIRQQRKRKRGKYE